MDSFMAAASDLDSILDQFEQNEDSTFVLQPEPVPFSKPTMRAYRGPNSTQAVNGGDGYRASQETVAFDSADGSRTPAQPSEPDSTEFLLDLSEADFAPASPQTLSLNSLGIGNPESYQPASTRAAPSTGSVPNQPGSLPGANTDPLSRTGAGMDFSGEPLSQASRTPDAPTPSVGSAPLRGVARSSGADTGSLRPSVAEQRALGNSDAVHSGSPGSPGLIPDSPSLDQSPRKEEADTRKESEMRTETQGLQPGVTEPKEPEAKPLSKSLTPAPLRPELMHEYVKQGARPKVIANLKSPDSPAKAVGETTSTTPSMTGKGATQPKPPVGFGNVASVKVTDADLEELEKEVGIMPTQDKGKPAAQPAPQPQAMPGHLSLDDLSTPGERISPVSKLLNEHFAKSRRPEPALPQGNELAGLDPFFSPNGPTARPDSLASPVPSTRLLDASPAPQSSISPPPHPSLAAVPAEPPMQTSTKGITLPNDVLSKNAKNLLRNNQALPVRQPHGSSRGDDPSTQLNNSNSQIRASKIPVGAGQVPVTSQADLLGGSPAVSTVPGTQGVQPRPEPDFSSLDPVPKSSSNVSQQSNRAFPARLPAPMPGAESFTDQRHPPEAVPAPSLLPTDPPSYQDVRNAIGTESDRRSDGLRQGLSLNFDQPGPRKVAQTLPPSPIIEDVHGRDDAFGAPVQNATSESLHPNPAGVAQRLAFQPPPQVQQAPAEFVPPTVVAAAPNVVAQNSLFPDNDSITRSNETDSEEGEFSRRVMDYSEGVVQLGAVAPVWVPDADAQNCMNCQQKFTFRKRRHHCRACGKVFCAKCCSMRLKLKYMESKEARVCISCLNVILRAQALQRTQVENHPVSEPAPPPSQDQDNLSNVSSTSESLSGGNVGSRSSLRRPSTDGPRPKEMRKVRFSDGLNPGTVRPPRDAVVAAGPPPAGTEDGGAPPRHLRGLGDASGSSLIPGNEGALPPVVTTETSREFRVRPTANVEELIGEMKIASAPPVTFALNRNLLVRTKILDLNCCVNRTCWCFSTRGMATVGQDEIVVVLECLPDEKTVPRDIFHHLQSLYEQASRGVTVSHMGHSLFSQSFLGGREHGGFLYLRPSFQCLARLLLPEPPYLFAVLLQKWETPWAKVFPLRLLLRLGAEFRYYPCPLMSVRFRKPVFGEIGHTIMNLLADFKNYQYKLPVIPGIVIHMQDRETLIQIPRNRYNEVMKVVNNSNEHVMAIAANFSSESDSHLVCIQNDEGTYHTQAISIQNKPRKVTGASFVVFNGALKTTSGLTAKSSIVEDGLMIQILPETMAALRQALRDMLDLPVPCGTLQAEQPDETVTIQWVDDDKTVNMGVVSPIDRRSLDGVDSIRIHNGTDFRGRSHSLRWTEVFFLENNESPVDLSRLAEMLSSAFCVALTGQLDELQEAGMVKLALRVTVDSDNVGYEAGSKDEPLSPVYMNELDNELIPVLHNAVSQHEGGPVVMELVFYIID